IPERDLLGIKALVIMLAGSLYRVVIRRVCLKDHDASLPTTTSPTGYLCQQLERSLGAAEIRQVEHRIRLNNADSRDARQIESLTHHLRADNDVDVMSLGAFQHDLIAMLADGIGVPAHDTCIR